MRISKLAAAAFLGVAALGLSACANTLSTEVSRYQAMPAAGYTAIAHLNTAVTAADIHLLG